MRDAYQFLKRNLQISQIKNTELIEVTVFDEDKSLATKMANEIGKSYRNLRIKATNDALRREHQATADSRSTNDEPSIAGRGQDRIKKAMAAIAGNIPLVNVISPAEDAIRPARPNRYRNIFLGAVLALAVGGMMILGLWLLKLKRARNESLAAA